MRTTLFLLLLSVLPNGSRTYEANLISVYDGDTVTMQVHLGINTYRVEKIRLYGIDAPEIRGEEREEGLVSKAALEKKLRDKDVILETIKNDKRGKYGRLLGILHIGEENINEWMIKEGYAEEKYY